MKGAALATPNERIAPTSSVVLGLSPKQAETLTFLQGYAAEHGHYPSSPIIASALKIRRQAVPGRMETLRRKGLIATDRGEELSDGAAAVLAYVKAYLLEWQRPPAIREVAKRFGWSSTNAVARHCESLRQHGLIAIDREGGTRNIRVLGAKLRWEEGT